MRNATHNLRRLNKLVVSYVNTPTHGLHSFTRSSQSIIIGKSDLIDLIDVDCIDQSAEIDDTLVSFIDLS